MDEARRLSPLYHKYCKAEYRPSEEISGTNITPLCIFVTRSCLAGLSGLADFQARVLVACDEPRKTWRCCTNLGLLTSLNDVKNVTSSPDQK